MSTSSRSLESRILREERHLDDLRPAWDELLAASVRPEPMLSADWLIAWQRIYGKGRALCVGVYEADGQLVGLAPMCSRVFRYRPGIPFRRIEPLGSDVEEGDGVCSDYLHLIVRPGFEEAVAQAYVADMNAGVYGPWDEWLLPSVDGDHPLTPILVAAWARAGRTVLTTVADVCPYLEIPPTWDDFLATLSKSGRRSFRSCLVDFQKWSEGRAIVQHATDAASLAEGKRVLQALHRERWHADEKEGAFSSPRFCAFHDIVLQHLLDDDRLDLRWLTLDGRALAAYYAFRYGDKLYYYQAGRTVDVPPKVRLGIVILVDGLKDAMARGLREFDFLAGQAQYKSLFTDTSRKIVELRVAKPTLREAVRKTLTTGVRMFRQVRARLQTKVQVPKHVNQTERPV